MKPGPPPEPLHLKLLKGNPGRRKLRDEPQPEQAPGVPEPPSFITGYAADLWWETAPELHRLGLLTKVDLPALSAYCHSFGQWRLASEALAKMAANDPVTHGMLIKRDGGIVVNPLVSIARKAAGDMIRYASEFGLTAAARARLSAGGYAPPSTPSKFGGLLSDGGTVVPMRRGDGKTSPPDAS